jgi:ribosomal protein S18 acetylase RimI-like enzyme
LRRQGLGAKLMRAVETEAILRGCPQIVLETHTFQAPIFYQKLGFVDVGHADDYPKSHHYLLLVKQIC